MADPQLLTSIDGVITPSTEAVLPLPDDGLFRGDGVFEVLRSYEGHVFALSEHLDRMEASAAVLDLQIEREQVEADAAALIAQPAAGEAPGGDQDHGSRMVGPDCLLRIIVTRAGRRVLTLEPLPVYPLSVSLATVSYSPSVILNGVKSLSYAANMQATRIAKESGADEALLITPEDVVLEPPTSTLFWVSPDGPLRTTDTRAGVLDSITRRKVIERCEVETGHFGIEDVMASSEVFLASTTREIQPVHAIDGQPIPTVPAPRTNEAGTAFAEAVAEECGAG
ncbi:MAG: aminotransferase class IV [Solirubrobacterales bacterium]